MTEIANTEAVAKYSPSPEEFADTFMKADYYQAFQREIAKQFRSELVEECRAGIENGETSTTEAINRGVQKLSAYKARIKGELTGLQAA